MELWRKMPLPIAELGVQLSVEDPGYFAQLLALSEVTLGLPVAIGMARCRHCQGWFEVAPQLRGLLHKSALGNRQQAVDLLDKLLPGACGWELRERSGHLAGLVRATFPSESTPAPTIRQGIAAIVRVRNAYAHPSAGASLSDDFLGFWEESLHALLEANRILKDGSFLWTEQVRKEASGGFSFIARSLDGPAPSAYRRGTAQPAAEAMEPQHVYIALREGEWIDLHPFVVSDGAGAYVLTELQSSGAVLWRPATGERWAGDDGDEIRAALADFESAATTPDRLATPHAVASSTDSSATGNRSATYGLAFLGVASGMIVLVVLLGLIAGYLLLSSDEEPETAAAGSSSRETEPLAPAPEACRVSVDGEVTAANLPRFLSGADIAWGDEASEVDARCGPLDMTRGEVCTQDLIEWRRLIHRTPFVPGRTVRMPFHRDEGLFEVLVDANASAEEMVERLEGRLGFAPRRQGRAEVWDLGAASIQVSVSKRTGNTVVKAWHEQRTGVYREDRKEVCK